MKGRTDMAALPSRVHRSAGGMWHVFFQGRLVYDRAGRMREFASEKAAQDYLDRCLADGRLVE